MRAVEVIVAPATTDDVRLALRTLAERGSAARTASPGTPVRTWAVLGELGVDDGLSENDAVVEHDRVGRQAVRLAVDKTVCVGDSRAVRALHQGAVMEGSWGDEVRLVATAADARALLTAEPDWTPAAGDVVLIAGRDPGVIAVAELWRGGTDDGAKR
ncbi:UDP-N-acetylmuramoyl-tripeptide--D-alanyl-D-alanine ligase [Gordonia sp. CPCC 205515]|uniref:UDP-N-acetylmuramoyl-tripeptide--D-alanyl-D- alanine ligase n=1 Tax=Gordonia sp. CPCC 205515 TaxID=3140791 RepID=UPI003AF40177